jgi:hypothetical protein
MQALGLVSPLSTTHQRSPRVAERSRARTGIDLIVNISDCPVPRHDHKVHGGLHPSTNIDGISAHDWETPADDVGMTIVSRIVDALGGMACHDTDFQFTIVFIATTMFTASLASRVIEMIRRMTSSRSCITAVPLLGPMEVAGRASLDTVLALQMALAYCDLVVLRGVDDYLSLYDRNSLTASFEDLCACVAADLAGWLIIRAASPGFGTLTCVPHSKLCDVRSSLWKRCCFAQKTASTAAEHREVSTAINPMRSLTANIHALHKSAIEMTERTQLQWEPAEIAVLCCEVAYFSAKPSTESKQLADLSTFDPIPRSLQESIDVAELSRQLRAASPGVRWGHVQVIEPLKVIHEAGSTTAKPTSSSRGKRTPQQLHNNTSSVDSNTASVHAVLVFPSPYAEAMLRAAMQSATSLLCNGGRAFMLDRYLHRLHEYKCTCDKIVIIHLCFR